MIKPQVAVLVGTRPELIKMAPVLRVLKKEGIPYIFIHSGQHYSVDLDSKIMQDLKVGVPDYNLRVGSGSHAIQTGKIMEGVERVCMEVKPKMILVHGDTNTALGGALSAKKLHIAVGHIEAGLRSGDLKMPEEVNRVLVDRISDILFAPTGGAKQNLLNEGINTSAIVVTGNTVVDAVNEHLEFAKKSTICEELSLHENQYILVTAHRPENVDDETNINKLISLIDYVSAKLEKVLVWPMHPRTKKQIDNFNITIPSSFVVIPPVGYIDMLTLMAHSSLILTDSGGVQEEAYILRKPLITLRDSTERPETLSANFLVHLDKEKMDEALKSYEGKKISWSKVFGDGHASEKIVKTLKEYLIKE